MRRRQVFLALGLIVLAAMLVRHPSADIRVITHDVADPSPRKIEAAVDIGVFALSLLVTWTGKAVTTR